MKVGTVQTGAKTCGGPPGLAMSASMVKYSKWAGTHGVQVTFDIVGATARAGNGTRREESTNTRAKALAIPLGPIG